MRYIVEYDLILKTGEKKHKKTKVSKCNNSNHAVVKLIKYLKKHNNNYHAINVIDVNLKIESNYYSDFFGFFN